MKPIIGIIMRKSLSDGGYPIELTYANLLNAIIKSGGVPIGITNTEDINEYLKICAGFVLQGGDDFDILNFDIIDLLRKKNYPLLGICQGMQEIAYKYNGLIKEIPNHKGIMHEIKIDKDTLLYKILKKTKIKVNSRHKLAIINTNLQVSSRSIDGIIESVEDKNNSFFLGLQWHPESIYDDDINSQKIFKYFINACKIKK